MGKSSYSKIKRTNKELLDHINENTFVDENLLGESRTQVLKDYLSVDIIPDGVGHLLSIIHTIDSYLMEDRAKYITKTREYLKLKKQAEEKNYEISQEDLRKLLVLDITSNYWRNVFFIEYCIRYNSKADKEEITKYLDSLVD